MTGDLSTALDEIRHLLAEYEKQADTALAIHEVTGSLAVGYDVAPAAYRLAAHVPHLVAALDRVLALAEMWDRGAAADRAKADSEISGAAAAVKITSALAYEMHALELRNAIAAELAPAPEAADA